jgi:TRAP-type C4-dicarboxylate transport system permease small subunit
MTAAVAEPESGNRVPRQHGTFETWFLLVNRALVVAMMAVMVALVFTNVVTRYVFGFSVTWAEEFSQYLMVWIAFVGAGLALREGRHVAVEMVQDLLSPQSKHRLRTLVACLMMVFFIVVAYFGILFANFAVNMQTPMMNISLAIPYACVPIGMTFLLVHLLFIWRGYVAGEHEVSESLESIDEKEL